MLSKINSEFQFNSEFHDNQYDKNDNQHNRGDEVNARDHDDWLDFLKYVHDKRVKDFILYENLVSFLSALGQTQPHKLLGNLLH